MAILAAAFTLLHGYFGGDGVNVMLEYSQNVSCQTCREVRCSICHKTK
jgi:hypothetical protein